MSQPLASYDLPSLDSNNRVSKNIVGGRMTVVTAGAESWDENENCCRVPCVHLSGVGGATTVHTRLYRTTLRDNVSKFYWRVWWDAHHSYAELVTDDEAAAWFKVNGYSVPA